MIIADVVELQSSRGLVAQHHVVLAEAAEVAEAGDLPIEPDRAQEGRCGNIVVTDVVDLESASHAVA